MFNDRDSEQRAICDADAPVCCEVSLSLGFFHSVQGRQGCTVGWVPGPRLTPPPPRPPAAAPPDPSTTCAQGLRNEKLGLETQMGLLREEVARVEGELREYRARAHALLQRKEAELRHKLSASGASEDVGSLRASAEEAHAMLRQVMRGRSRRLLPAARSSPVPPRR